MKSPPVTTHYSEKSEEPHVDKLTGRLEKHHLLYGFATWRRRMLERRDRRLAALLLFGVIALSVLTSVYLQAPAHQIAPAASTALHSVNRPGGQSLYSTHPLPSGTPPGYNAQKTVEPPLRGLNVLTPAPTPAVASSSPPARQVNASPVAGVTIDDNVTMRTGPGTAFDISSQLPVGARVSILARQGGWYQVTTAWNSSGWIAVDFLKTTDMSAAGLAVTAADWLGSANVVNGSLNLRSGPGINYSSIELLPEGALLDVLVLGTDWYKVRSSGGTVGWVASTEVALDWIPEVYGGVATGTSSTGTSASSTSNDAVKIAQRYLGARYIWGGSDPGGFDCSGLTMYVYGRLGVQLPRTSPAQFSTDYGRVIGEIRALAPGDLVFFRGTTANDGITHVGIYAGAGRMIAARSERLGVRYVSLSEPFWKSRFVGGLRPYR